MAGHDINLTVYDLYILYEHFLKQDDKKRVTKVNRHLQVLVDNLHFNKVTPIWDKNEDLDKVLEALASKDEA